jgi:hypothetical protein
MISKEKPANAKDLEIAGFFIPVIDQVNTISYSIF